MSYCKITDNKDFPFILGNADIEIRMNRNDVEELLDAIPEALDNYVDQKILKHERNFKAGTYNGETTFCPVLAGNSCFYCDNNNVCHIFDPQEDCSDWQYFFKSWDEWVQLG